MISNYITLAYIDPGTGSMLVAILIGIIGALNYAFRLALVKIKFVLSGGKQQEVSAEKIPYVIFSDNKRYWVIFEPICREFDARGIDVVYMTASEDDPVFDCGLEHIKPQFIGSGNMAYAKLNFLKAGVLLSTTPGLDVYQWKRSKEVDYYVHTPHAAGEIVLYRMFGITFYDGLLLSGKFQEEDVRKLDEIWKLPAKDIEIVGLPYMDEMLKRFKAAPPVEAHERTVLLAPSWGPSAIFSKLGGDIIGELLKTGYHVIVRPHPQSFDSEAELLAGIMEKYPESEQLEWNRDVDNFEVLRRSDILISDFSGVVFDFALVYDKPVIYADTSFDRAPYDAWWMDSELWIEKTLPRIGIKLEKDSIADIKEIIDKCIDDPRFAKGRDQARAESWEHVGEGAVRTVDWLIKKHEELEGKAD
ncbi:MAG: CDP-glycerol glycerophosphotransferase family protein [Pseudobutyrivibrio sp.]|nr:CDP-glycerol glycerophosphotransferase family protein [Pseudobutyrivibrio sp.]